MSFKEDVGNISAITKALDDMDVKTARTAVNATKWSNEFKELAINSSTHLDMADDILDIGDAAAASTTQVSAFGATLKGIGATLVSMAPFLVAGAALAGLAYGLYKYAHAFEDQLEKAAKAGQVYDESKAEVESLNSELETTNARIAELQAQDTLTLTEEAELANLQAQTAELERQIALKDQLAEANNQEAAKEAMDTLEMKRTKDLTTEETVYSMSAGDAKQKYDETDIITATDNEIKQLQKLKKERDKLAKGSRIGLTDRENADIDAKIDSLDSEMERYKSAINENLDAMNQIKPYLPIDSEAYKNISSLTDEFNNWDLSGAEQAVAKIESFFSGGDIASTAISDRLKEMAADGTLTADAIERMGFAIDGVDAADIARYFNDMAKSAQEAADAANQIDGSFEGVAAAMESENAGSNYEKLNDYLKTAKDLYDKDLTGTDDFKSVAELLSYGDSKGNADQFIADYNRVMKYITEDDDGNLTKSGIGQFLNDLSEAGKNVGKDWATLNDETGEWSFNLDNTAQAAKEMGLSIESMEAILGRLQDYDNVGDFQFKSALQDISDATTALEGMKTLYDEMDEGRSKEALGLKIEGWDEQYAQWENDWSTLDENAVIHIKLDYDLSKIQADIDEIQSLITGGDNSVENRAALYSKNEQYIGTAESALGISQLDPVQIPVEYSNLDNAIAKLQTELQSNDYSAEQKVEIQAEMNNIQDIQMDLLDAFSASEYSVNLSADSSVEEIQSKMNEFFASAEGQKILADVDVSDENLKRVLADIKGVDVDDIELSITAEDEATPVVENLAALEVPDKITKMIAEDEASGALYLWNSLSMDEKFSAMSADDQATFVIREWNGLQPEQKQALLQAEMTANDNASAPIDNVTGKANTLAGIDPTVGISANDAASSVISSVMAKVNSADGMTATTTIITRHVTVGSPSGGAGANGTAHASGTAFSNGTAPNSGHAFNSGTSGDWTTKKPETALVGELGTELWVDPRTGMWETIGRRGAEFRHIPAGSIIFNHKQTEEIFKNGYVTSNGGRGKAFARGTAYAGGASGSFNFTSGSSKSYSSSTSSKSATSAANTATKAATSAAKATTAAAESTESAADAMKDLLDKLNKYVDWVKIKLDRVNRDTQKAIDAIDTAVGLANKQASTSTAISKTQTEMSVARQAYDRYIAEANSVASQTGLSSDIQAKIKNGSIEISEYDDNTQEKIKLFQQYYELALDALDTIDDLKKQEQELALQRLENIQDYYDAVMAVYDATISVNEAKMELETALGNAVDSKGIKDAINNSIGQQQSTYNKALQQLTDYQSEFNDLVAKGYIQRDSDAWYEGQKVIQEFTAQVSESATALIELQDQLRQIDYTKLQQTIDRISSSLDRLQNGDKVKEARDERVTEEEYRKQMSEEDKSIAANRQLRNKKLEEQALYAVGSERYNEIAEEIAKIDDEISSSLINIEDLKDKIFEVRFADFDYDRQAMKNLQDDLGVLQDLLNSDAFVDSKSGALTGEGLANIALIGQQMAIAKQEIAEYTTGIKKLDGMLQSGLISTTEYEERQREFLEAIQESAISVSDFEEQLVDLYITQLNAENEALQKSITLRKKALKATKEYYDYADSINSQSKDINAIKSQIAALSGVNNLQAKSELKRLQDELAIAEKSLADTKRDHEYEVISNGYDELSDGLNESLENVLYELTYNSSKQEEVVSNMLNNVVNMYSDAYGTIQDIISSTGIVGTSDFNNSVSNIGSSSGAANIVADATQSQGTISSGDTTNSISTGHVETNHSAVEKEISKEANTTNRPVAELTIDKTSVTLEEGKSTSVSIGIRPTDAKNKTLNWTSSNPGVATVSGGTIKAIRQGSATITASTTDGSGLSKSCGVTVTPKPTYITTPTNTSTSTQGDGKIQVGDKVTFTSGRYYYDSYGTRPAGSKYQGKQVTITHINTKGSKPYHISTGSKLGSGDLGWLTQSQISGYYTGTKSAKDELAFIDDTASGNADPGSEVIMTRYGALRQMNAGDKVFSKAQTEKLWELSKNAINNNNITPNTGFAGYNVQSQDDHSVTQIFDAPLINIENASSDVMGQIEKNMPKITNMMAVYLKKEARKS